MNKLYKVDENGFVSIPLNMDTSLHSNNTFTSHDKKKLDSLEWVMEEKMKEMDKRLLALEEAVKSPRNFWLYHYKVFKNEQQYYK